MDIEFALGTDGNVYLFQVRPISTKAARRKGFDATVEAGIEQVGAFFSSQASKRAGLGGARTVYANMSDWNPAEIIGSFPRPLAVSLYRHLIMNKTWRDARVSMGYQFVPQDDLMVVLLSRPFIDLRASFNSFLPDGVSTETADLCVGAWLDRLDSKPELHDKVEFEIVPTVLDFCFDSSFDDRYPGLLKADMRETYKRALGHLTMSCLSQEKGSILALAEAKVAELQSRQQAYASVDLDAPVSNLIHATRILLEDCRVFGTLPFSILARLGFVAEALMRSAVNRGALSDSRFDDLKRSVDTVASQFSKSFEQVRCGEVSLDAFFAEFGHLRPGTYDIRSRRYRDRQDFFVESEQGKGCAPQTRFELTPKEERDLANLLGEVGYSATTPVQLVEFYRRAVPGREFSKFAFSWNLSEALEMIALVGQKLDLDRDDLSFLNIDDILSLAYTANLCPPQSVLKRRIANAREERSQHQSVKLGYIIRDLRDLNILPLHRSKPNYLSNALVRSTIVELSSISPFNLSLHGHIACIENADPGFDWIFTKGIAGLITKFGGPNSHMAIRCAELGVPAAIGVGEDLFQRVLAARSVELDCGHETLVPFDQ